VVAVSCAAWLAVAFANAEPKQDGLEMVEGGFLRAEYDSTFEDYPEGVTVEGWFYFTDVPADDELWVLVMKPASYGLLLSGRLTDDGIDGEPPGTVRVHTVGFVSDGFGVHSSGIAPREFPLRRWVHMAVAYRGAEPTRDWTYVDRRQWGRGGGGPGTAETPLLIGGTDLDFHAPSYASLLSRVGSISGYVGSVRVSRGVRYTDKAIRPARALQADADTLALWILHDAAVALYADKSGNGRPLRRRGALTVEAGGKATTVWGRLRRVGETHDRQRR